MTTPDPPWTDDDPEWPVLGVRTAWETQFFEAGYDLVERPGGDSAKYYWLEPADAAVVVPVTDDGELVLVEQYRPRYRTRTLNFPAGFCEAGEDPAEAAARELREETGYVADDLAYLDTITVSPWTRYVRHVYAVRDLDSSPPDPGDSDLDEGEFIEVRTVPVDDAMARFRAGEGPSSGMVLAVLTLAREEGVL